MSERELERLRQRAGARKGKKGKNIEMKLKMVVSSKDDSVVQFFMFCSDFKFKTDCSYH